MYFMYFETGFFEAIEYKGAKLLLFKCDIGYKLKTS